MAVKCCKSMFLEAKIMAFLLVGLCCPQKPSMKINIKVSYNSNSNDKTYIGKRVGWYMLLEQNILNQWKKQT